MQEEIEQKTVTLIINSGKLSGRILAGAFSKFLRFSANKVKQHHDIKPQGKQSVKALVKQNQGVDTTELADKEAVKDFDRIARRYGVDYAIKKGVNENGEPRYMVFFKARDRGAIDQAMQTYASQYHDKSKDNRPSLRKALQELRKILPGKSKEKQKEITR